MRNGYGDKMLHFNHFFSPHFYVSVFLIYISLTFGNGRNVVLTIYMLFYYILLCGLLLIVL